MMLDVEPDAPASASLAREHEDLRRVTGSELEDVLAGHFQVPGVMVEAIPRGDRVTIHARPAHPVQEPPDWPEAEERVLGHPAEFEEHRGSLALSSPAMPRHASRGPGHRLRRRQQVKTMD
jgi:hypothetical protein